MSDACGGKTGLKVLEKKNLFKPPIFPQVGDQVYSEKY